MATYPRSQEQYESLAAEAEQALAPLDFISDVNVVAAPEGLVVHGRPTPEADVDDTRADVMGVLMLHGIYGQVNTCYCAF
jgi:hypothetical protein